MSLTRRNSVAVVVDTIRETSPRRDRDRPWSGCWTVESGFKAVIDQTSCFSKTTIINITLLSIHLLTWNWHPEEHFMQLEASWSLSFITSIWFDEWRGLKKVSHSRASSIIISFYHPSWELRYENGSSLLTATKFHHGWDALILPVKLDREDQKLHRLIYT